MKKFAKSFVAFALAVGAFAFGGGLSACGGKTQETERPTNVDITKTAAPTDGSLPTAHSAAENLAYVAYVLDSQPQYHCYTYTVTNASIATQYTKSYKDYKDGVTVSSDITYSSMVKSGSQAVFVNGENGQEAYMRFSEAPDANTDHLNAKWSNGAPVHFNEQAYLYTYGLFQTELTNYIINAQTIIDSKEIKVNGDGTYTQSVTLDPKASTYYYQYGMKTRGNLGSYPDFQSVKLSVTFDSSWRVTALDIDEVSLVNKGVTVTSTSVSHAEYSYGDDTFDNRHYAFYNDYFKQYIGSTDLEEGGNVDQEMVVDVTNVLSNGFAKIMDGGQQFEVKALLGENEYVGYIFLSLDLADPLNTLHARISLGQTLDEQTLYIEYADGEALAYYGENFALTVNIAALKPHIDAFGEWLDGLNQVFSGAVQAEQAGVFSSDGDPLTELMNAMALQTTDSSALLSLVTDDLLGLGVGVDAELAFGVTKDAITFRSASISGISVGGEGLDLTLTLKSTTADVISREKTDAEANLADYVADVFKLLSSDLIKVDLKLDGNSENVMISGLKGLEISATAYVDIDGVTVGADVNLGYTRGSDKISATVNAYYDYDPASSSYGKLVVTVTSLNGVETDAQVCCDLSELIQAITPLLQAAGLQDSALDSSEFDIASDVVGIINGALSADFSNIMSGLYADKSKIKVSVDVDEILNAIAVDAGVQFGKCNLVYALADEGGELSVALPAIGFNLAVTGASGEIINPKGENCLDLTDLVNAVNCVYGEIGKIVQTQKLSFTVSDKTVLTYGKVSASLSGSGEVSWKEGEEGVALDLSVALSNNADVSATLKLIYDKNAGDDKPVIRLAIGKAAIDIYEKDLNGFGTQLDSLSSTFAQTPAIETGDTDQLLSLLFSVLSGTDWVKELNNFTLTSDGKSVAVSYLSDAAVDVVLSADGELKLSYDLSYNDLVAAAEISASSATGVAERLSGEFDAMSPASTANGDSFVKLIYDFAFDSFNSVDIKNVLGESYGLSLTLDGDESPVSALSGIKVDATLGFSSCTAGNVADLMLDISVSGVQVKLNLTLIGEDIYASLINVSGNEIPHLKIRTTADSLYLLVSDLIDTAVNSNLLSQSLAVDTGSEEVEETKLSISSVVTALVEFDWNSALICAQTENVKSVTLDLDNALNQLGIQPGYSIGCVKASITSQEGKAPKLSVNAVNNGKIWLSIGSYSAEKDYENINKDEYIDFSEVTALNIVDVLNLVNAENLELNLSLDNSDYGIKAEGAVYISPKGLTVGVEDLTVTYVYSGMPVSATVSAYYQDDEIYLHLTNVNGADCAVSVKCKISEMTEAISALLTSAQISVDGIGSDAPIEVESLVENALKADYSAIISGVFSDKNGLGVSVDADKLLEELGVELDVSIGNIKLDYAVGNSDLGGTLSVEVKNLGLALSLSGSEKAPSNSTEDCLDLTELVNLVNDALANRTFEIGLSFGGANIGGVDLTGVTADATAFVNLGETPWAYATVEASYAYDENTVIDLELSAYYEYADGKNNVYLTLNKIGNLEPAFAVYCEVSEIAEAVKQLLTYFNVGEIAMPETSIDTASVISGILSADFETLIGELTANSAGLTVTVDLDNILAILGTELDIELGKATLNYNTADKNFAVNAANFGLGLTASVSEQTKPAYPADCLDLTELVNLVNDALANRTFEIG
ncbi:MAG: hypothetical protein ACI4MH_07470, partial [Candidatus Coproplasma sp.]